MEIQHIKMHVVKRWDDFSGMWMWLQKKSILLFNAQLNIRLLHWTKVKLPTIFANNTLLLMFDWSFHSNHLKVIQCCKNGLNAAVVPQMNTLQTWNLSYTPHFHTCWLCERHTNKYQLLLFIIIQIWENIQPTVDDELMNGRPFFSLLFKSSRHFCFRAWAGCVSGVCERGVCERPAQQIVLEATICRCHIRLWSCPFDPEQEIQLPLTPHLHPPTPTSPWGQNDSHLLLRSITSLRPVLISRRLAPQFWQNGSFIAAPSLIRNERGR